MKAANKQQNMTADHGKRERAHGLALGSIQREKDQCWIYFPGHPHSDVPLCRDIISLQQTNYKLISGLIHL